MTQKQERLFSSLYFTNEEKNGVKTGKVNPLFVRFLYADMEQIPMGRAHLFEYTKGKYSKVLCLKDGIAKKDLEKHSCPLCDTDRFGTPASKLFAFVQDLNDGGKLKLFEFSYTLSKQIEEMAEEQGVPLHDITFKITKRGSGKETTYTPIPKGTDKFSVMDYFTELGIDNYPVLVGDVASRAPILQLDAAQMTDFLNGKYPWSSGDGGSKRKYTSLTSTITVHGNGSTQNALDESEDLAIVEELSDELPDFSSNDDVAGLF